MGPDGSIVFTYREFLGDVTGSTAFNLANYFINPGLSSTFPFASRIAQNFQQYEFEHIFFEFKSKSSDALNSTNTALGTVVTATNYNCCEPNFANKVQMEATIGNVSERPSKSQIHGLDVRPSSTPLPQLYIRTQAVPSNQDQHLYDLANFQIATSGMQAAANIGELWVDYSMKLMKPRLPEAESPGELYGHISASSGCTSAVPLGTFVVDPLSTIPLNPKTMGPGTNSAFHLPYQGTFMVIGMWESATGGPAPPGFNQLTIPSNLSITNFRADSVAGIFSNSGSGSSSAYFAAFVTVTTAGVGDNNAVYVQMTGLTGGAVDIYVFPVPTVVLQMTVDEKLNALREKLQELEYKSTDKFIEVKEPDTSATIAATKPTVRFW